MRLLFRITFSFNKNDFLEVLPYQKKCLNAFGISFSFNMYTPFKMPFSYRNCNELISNN